MKRQIKWEALSAYIAPTVTPLGSYPVLDKSALLRGFLDDKGSALSVVVYFEWGTSTGYGLATDQQTLAKDNNVFSAWVTPLKGNTTYHFRVVAVGDGITYNNDETFRTLP